MRDVLSIKQQNFCEYYIELGNATEAAKRAGYSEKTAYSIGTENLKKPEIEKYIKELSEVPKTARIAAADEVLEFFSEIMRDKSEETKNRLKAAENLAKRYGVDKSGEQADIESKGQPIFEFVFKDMTMKDENEN